MLERAARVSPVPPPCVIGPVRLQVAAEDEATAHAAVQSIDDTVLDAHTPHVPEAATLCERGCNFIRLGCNPSCLRLQPHVPRCSTRTTTTRASSWAAPSCGGSCCCCSRWLGLGLGLELRLHHTGVVTPNPYPYPNPNPNPNPTPNPTPTPTPNPNPNPNPSPNPTLPLTRRGQPYWRHGFPHTGGLHALGAQGGASGVDSERALVRVAVGALTSSEVRITVIV